MNLQVHFKMKSFFFFFLYPDTKSPHLRLMYQSVSRSIVLLILVLVFHLGTPVPPCRHRRIRIHPTLTTTNPFIIFYIIHVFCHAPSEDGFSEDVRRTVVLSQTLSNALQLFFENYKSGNLFANARTIKQSPKGWKVGRRDQTSTFYPFTST